MSTFYHNYMQLAAIFLPSGESFWDNSFLSILVDSDSYKDWEAPQVIVAKKSWL
jgi:hypothetical protein